MDDEKTISSELRDTLQRHRSGGNSEATLVLSDREGNVGDRVTLKGRNLPPEAEFDLVWHSTDGRWGVLQGNEVVGPQYRPRTEEIATVTTDGSGRFDETWTIPQDYGGSHRINVTKSGRGTIATAEFELVPHFELDRTAATMGEAFTLTGYGIGPNVITNNYQVTWDNSDMGFMTGVMNRGTATARIRAVGPPGEHVIQVWRCYKGSPYLQVNTQSPYGPVAGGGKSTWTVEVTEPDERPRTAWIDERFDEKPISAHYPELDADTDAELEISPTCGQPGTAAFVTGRNFPAEAEVDLVWYHHDGHRAPEGTKESPTMTVSPEPRPDVLPTVTTDEDGRFQEEITIPKSVGSTRPITAAVDGREVAVTGFMMQPSIETFAPDRGEVGTEIEIELSGIGWTMYENAPYFVYDNKPLGYVCGTGGRDGVVRAKFPATGEPGYHFVDVYPSLFETREDEPRFALRPHLSYLDNHPMRPLPAFHFAFEIPE